MHQTKSALIFKLAAIAAAVSVQGVALAQPAAAPATTATEQSAPATSDATRGGHHAHPHHQHMHRHHDQRRAAFVVPGYGSLGEKSVEALKLNDSQKKLLQQAQEAQKGDRAGRFDVMKEERQERYEALKAGKLDPRAALKDAEAAHQAAIESRAKISEKWLAVWDSLDEGQQKLVGQQLAERAGKRAERMQKYAERRAKQTDSAEQADSAKPEAAAPTAD